jgi:hypothetical protein
MKKLFVLLTLFALAFLPSAARSAISPETAGVRPHGCDCGPFFDASNGK